jgi:hypothetical protein
MDFLYAAESQQARTIHAAEKLKIAIRYLRRGQAF